MSNDNPLIANKVVLPVDGTAAAPSIQFGGCAAYNSGNGFYLKSDGVIGVSIGGTEVFNWSSSGPSEVGTLALGDGTVGAPSLSFSSDATTGLFYAGSNGIKIATNGILALTISSAQLATFAGVIQTNAASNQLVINPGAHKFTITGAAPAADVVYTLPDAGGAASFVMSAGTQTIGGAKTFSSALTINPATNQLILGVTNTVTINAVAPSASRVYSIPDAGGASSFVMDAGAQSIAGIKTFSALPVFSVGISTPRANVASTATIASLASTNSYVKLTGSTATDLQGIAAGVNGQRLVLVNLTGQTLTIRNQSGSAASGAKITTMTGADVTTTGNGAAEFIYDTDASPAEWTCIWNTA